jgi:murein DD-endopeptidase MepM/ murein hydrolase activator NlpD
MNAARKYGLHLGLLVAAAVMLLASGTALPVPIAPHRDAFASPSPGSAVPQASRSPAASSPTASLAPTTTPTMTPSTTLSDSAQTDRARGATASAVPTTNPLTTSSVTQPDSAQTESMPEATATTVPTPVPTIASQPTAASASVVIGQSVQGRPITAYRIGSGPVKVVLIGNIHGSFESNTHVLAQQLLQHFEAHPEQVPDGVSLWILPTMNPDGLANGTRWNANDVDLNRNADTDLDGCAGNDWSPDTVGLEGSYPGAGGAYPFSEPEARAVRDFLSDAWMAVFYHSAAEGIFVDTCQRHAPTARLAEALSEGSGYPVPEEGWYGYQITGDFGDYLAGEGVATVTVELTDHQDPEFDRNLEGVLSLLSATDEILNAEADIAEASSVWLDSENTGLWHYQENSFLHPQALEVIQDTAYLLDAGRILALDLSEPAPPQTLLSPGDDVEDVRVLEPFDLASDRATLLVLDRAGDVYRYEPENDGWKVERRDRAPGETSDHYYVALDRDGQANYLLETSHEQVLRFADGQRGSPWASLPKSRDVDLSAVDGSVYALARAMNNPSGSLLRYEDGGRAAGFEPNVDLMHPRQVFATGSAVYVLDRAGRRLLILDPKSGALQALYQFTDRRDVSAAWADPSGERILLAGRDALYFYGEPQRQASIEGGPRLEGSQPHDLALLENLRGYSMPIEGANVTTRDFQMPGAPRHYRLGVHEGMDFYTGTAGVTINRDTPVRAVADGVVIRALTGYQGLTSAQAEAWYNQSLAAGYTPPDILDGYRGRQVWIDHGNDVISRYAHLSSIEPDIKEGVTVSRGQVIGLVGNSGTPASVSSETVEVHLHMELWACDSSAGPIEATAEWTSEHCHYVGQFLRPIEAREWLEKILR